MDTLLRNGFVYTADAANTCFARGALLISQGRLRWIGNESQLPDAADAHVVDLGGRIVMPGMINTHAHGGLSLHRLYVRTGTDGSAVGTLGDGGGSAGI